MRVPWHVLCVPKGISVKVLTTSPLEQKGHMKAKTWCVCQLESFPLISKTWKNNF